MHVSVVAPRLENNLKNMCVYILKRNSYESIFSIGSFPFYSMYDIVSKNYYGNFKESTLITIKNSIHMGMMTKKKTILTEQLIPSKMVSI